MRTNIVREERISISCDKINGWTLVEVDGEVDVHTSPKIRETFLQLLEEGHRKFVLDLCFVSFLDSMGLGLVVAVTKRIRDCKGSLRIACASPRVLKVFRIGGLSQAYDIYASPGEAAQGASPAGSLLNWPHDS